MTVQYTSHNRLLMQLFAFSEQDVSHNRVGKLSPQQAKRLHPTREFLLIDSMMLAALFLFPALIFSGIYLEYRSRFGPDAEMFLLAGLGILTFLAVVLVLGWVMLGQELAGRHIHTTEGRPVALQVPIHNRHAIIGYRYVVKIGKIQFAVDSELQLRTFNPDLTYRIHYWPHAPAHTILSIEVGV